MTALRGAELIAASLDQERAARDRGALALGAILCGYAIDSGMFALHHVVCQTLVRVCGSPHAETNAGDPAAGDGVHGARGPRRRSARWPRRSGPTPTRSRRGSSSSAAIPPGSASVGADRAKLDEALDAILARPELGLHARTPPGREELRGADRKRLVTARPRAV